MAYEQAGSGPAVVLLHGFVGDAAATWRHQIDALAAYYRVIAWDCPGMGASDDPPESFDMGDFADCLAGFVGQPGVQHAHLVGLSFGGTLALELAVRRPDIALT